MVEAVRQYVCVCSVTDVGASGYSVGKKVTFLSEYMKQQSGKCSPSEDEEIFEIRFEN